MCESSATFEVCILPQRFVWQQVSVKSGCRKNCERWNWKSDVWSATGGGSSKSGQRVRWLVFNFYTKSVSDIIVTLQQIGSCNVLDKYHQCFSWIFCVIKNFALLAVWSSLKLKKKFCNSSSRHSKAYLQNFSSLSTNANWKTHRSLSS